MNMLRHSVGYVITHPFPSARLRSRTPDGFAWISRYQSSAVAGRFR